MRTREELDEELLHLVASNMYEDCLQTQIREVALDIRDMLELPQQPDPLCVSAPDGYVYQWHHNMWTRPCRSNAVPLIFTAGATTIYLDGQIYDLKDGCFKCRESQH